MRRDGAPRAADQQRRSEGGDCQVAGGEGQEEQRGSREQGAAGVKLTVDAAELQEMQHEAAQLVKKKISKKK